MFRKSGLLLAMLVCSIWQQRSCSAVSQQSINEVSSHQEAKVSTINPASSAQSTEAPNLNKGIIEVLNAGSRSLEPWLKSISGLAKVIPGGGDSSDDPFGSFMNLIKPPTTTTTTTTTTAAPTTSPAPESSPVQQMASGLGSIPAALGQEQLFEAPVKVVSALTNNFNLTQAAEAYPLKDITRVGEQTTKVFTRLSGIRLTAPPEDETVYYEYAPSDEWDGHRKPRYFSKECNFRVACEVGRIMKPMLASVAQQFKTNKIVQDLQSRYSRAMAYGIMYDSCEKYYCVFLQLLGGPQKFVAATAEIVSQIAAAEPGEG